jgi:hypothetical protein
MTHRLPIVAVLTLVLALPLGVLAQTDVSGLTTTDTSGQTTTASGADTTSVSAPYDFQREGIFGCSYNGAYSMSVGAFAATGGTFVPVSDATVELNSGILVYQQCVLREVIDRMRESITSALVKQNIAALLTGRSGGPLFVRNVNTDSQQAANQAVLNYFQNNGLSSMESWFSSPVAGAVARGYVQSLDQSNDLVCAYPNVLTRDTFGWDQVLAIGSPACTPISAFAIGTQNIQTVAALSEYDFLTQASYGRGFLPDQTTDANGNLITTAPSDLIAALSEQTVQSGFNQLQNANDIGQMIGALFGGLGTQILSSNQGLAGLTQPNAGQPSYLHQLAAESSAGLRDTAVNAAITQLSAAQQVEQLYYQVLSSIAQTLTQTIAQIRGYESQCWTLIEQKVCTTPVQNGQCQDQAGNTVTITTSTAYSQAVINAQIAPIATTTAAELTQSQNTLNQINQLIAGVTNTTSLDAQRIALQQLDTLISSNQLHTQADVTTVQNQQQNVQAAMQTLAQNVPTTWGNGTPNLSNPYDPNSGWCNVNNSAVVQMWDQLWQKH